METTLQLKIRNNLGSKNPKHNPAARRRYHHSPDRPAAVPIPHFALKPKRDAMGRPIKGRFVRFWGGRKPSKYDPASEAIKHGRAA